VRCGPTLKPSRAAIAFLLSVLALGAFAEAKTLASLEEVASAALTSNLSYRTARAAARNAELAIPDVIKLKSATLAASYSCTDTADPGAGGVAAVKAVIPVLEQLSVSGNVSDDGSGSLAATVSPLAHSDVREQSLVSYRKALAAVDESGRSASVTAVKAALSWMSAERSLATKQKAVGVMETTYETTRSGELHRP